jgi:hypothetical protein
MGRLRKAVLILGEGPTELYYFKSLCDVYKGLTVKPDYPKHTTVKRFGCEDHGGPGKRIQSHLLHH